jgi:nucleoside-diphosphate-sugar epimerase
MHLARRFAAEGFHVVATISQPRERYGGIQARRLQALEAAVDLAELDVRNARAVSALVDRVYPSLWLQHAGYATNYASPDYDLAQGFSVNVLPLSSIYSALAGGRCGIIITGSSAEYAQSDAANREEESCWPDTPYGVSKLAETLQARILAERFSVPTRVARLYIPFGPLDHPDKLLAQTVACLSAGQPVALSPCNQLRDFIGIVDVCHAYTTLADDLPRTRFDIFNVCSGEPVRLRDFLLMITERMGAALGNLQFGAGSMREGEAQTSYGSNEKARQLLNWKPRSLLTAIDCDLLGRRTPQFDVHEAGPQITR